MATHEHVRSGAESTPSWDSSYVASSGGAGGTRIMQGSTSVMSVSETPPTRPSKLPKLGTLIESTAASTTNELRAPA